MSDAVLARLQAAAATVTDAACLAGSWYATPESLPNIRRSDAECKAFYRAALSGAAAAAVPADGTSLTTCHVALLVTHIATGAQYVDWRTVAAVDAADATTLAGWFAALRAACMAGDAP